MDATALQVFGSAIPALLAVLAPRLLHDLRITELELGMLVAAINVAAVPGLVFSSTLIHRAGFRNVLSWSAICCCGGVLLFLTRPPFAGQVIALGLFGLAWGVAAASGGSAVLAQVSPRRWGVASGVWQLGFPAGGVLAGLLGQVATVIGWQAAFLVPVVGLAAFGCAAAFLRLPRETHTPNALLRKPPVSAIRLGLQCLGLNLAQWAFIVYVTLELVNRLGLSFPIAAGLFLLAEVAGMAGRPVFGYVSDRIGPPRTPLLGILSVSAAILVLIFGLFSSSTPIPVVVLCVLALGFVVMGWNGFILVAFAESVPRAQLTASVGAGMTVLRIGSIAGPAAFGVLLASVGGRAAWFGLAALLLASGAILAKSKPFITPN